MPISAPAASPLTDHLARVRECVARHKAKPPAPTRCPHCGSLWCGPIRCRFSMESNTKHRGDKAVFLTTCIAAVSMAALRIGGYA